MTSITVEFSWLVGAVITIVSIVVTVTLAFVKYLGNRFTHLDERFDKIEHEQDLTDQKAEDIRTEIYREFVPRKEISVMRDNIGRVFARLDKLNGDLQKLIGIMESQAKHASDR